MTTEALHAVIRGPAHTALDTHKALVTDKLQGLLTAVDKVPGILHADAAQVAAVGKALLAREAGIHRTKEALAQLPTELAAYDQCVDELQQRSADIQRALHVLGAGGGGGGEGSSSGPAAAAATRGPAEGAAARAKP